MAETSTRVTGWVGWILFAAVMLVLAGTFNIIDGLVAVFKDDFTLGGPRGTLLVFDLTQWGWIHFVFGILQLLAGLALFTGKLWARIVAVVVVMLNAIGQLAFLSAYPIWSVVIITIDVLVIWALTVHGEEAAVAASRRT
jgi:hypothetical protein